MGEEGSVELERIYREQGERMWRSLLAFSGDPEISSDAVAEAFAQALRRVRPSETPSGGCGGRRSASPQAN